MPETTTPTEAADIIRVAQNALAVREVDIDQDYVVVDHVGRASILDLEKLRDEPVRPRGTYRPSTVQSFIEYVKVHADKEHTTVWVHPTAGTVVAVLDDNAASKTAWGEHRAELELLQTDEWMYWMELHDKLVDQQTFAEHLQNGMPDILEPDGAHLLEVAQSIRSTTAVKFRGGFKIHNGEVKAEYDETVNATAGAKGELTIPDTFLLTLAPFIGNEKVRVEAKLKHRTGGGVLKLGYTLLQPDRIVQAALDEIAAHLAETFQRVYRGTPAA